MNNNVHVLGQTKIVNHDTREVCNKEIAVLDSPERLGAGHPLDHLVRRDQAVCVRGHQPEQPLSHLHSNNADGTKIFHFWSDRRCSCAVTTNCTWLPLCVVLCLIADKYSFMCEFSPHRMVGLAGRNTKQLFQ